MVSVALIGPDGAGKTTVGKRLADVLPMPVKYIYMGVNADSSNLMLPTTRIIRSLKRAAGARPDKAGPPDPIQVKQRPQNRFKRILSGVRAGLRLANRLSEEWYRQGLAWIYSRQGNLVLFDRHYFSDYHAYDIAQEAKDLPFTRRIHGFILAHLYPKPGLVIYLDAPGEVLYARKREGTVEALERRRKDYLQIKDLVEHFEVIDATQPIDNVIDQVAGLITNYYEQHAGKRNVKVSIARN